MVKTRKGVKRISPKSSKEEPPDIESKKARLETESKSKYFNNTHKESVSDLNKNFSLDANKQTDSDNSNDSIVRHKPKQSLKIEDESDSDGSSSDEFMKAPISLDDLGNFETLKKGTKTIEPENKPFANSASQLSDDSDDEKQLIEQEFYDFSQIIKSQELIMNTKKEQEEKSKQVEQTSASNKAKRKTKLTKKVKKDNKPDLQSIGEELGISELLAIAEGLGMVSQDDSEDTGSDIDNKEVKAENYSVPKEGVQVTIELPNINQIKKKKGVDVEAALKRRINLIRKENQIYMHKVHTLCWIAHGIYLNRCINNEVLMGLALSLIPSTHCYPKKHMDLRYLEKLVEWFVGKLVVEKVQKLNLNSTNLSLVDDLESQINTKKASSERNLVLIFVCMLRSLGISVRLMINLRSVPIRPPVSDLCSLSNKPKEENSNSSKKSTTPSKLISPSNDPTKKASTKKSKNDSKKPTFADKKESEIKSPYFSSSDDLPLTEIVKKKKQATKSTGPSPLKIIDDKSNRRKNSKTASRKTFSAEWSKTSKSEYFDGKNNKQSSEKKQKGARKSAPITLKEDSSSSDGEVFQNRPDRKKKPKISPQNTNSKSTKSPGRRKSKIETDDSEYDSPKPSTSKLKDRRVLSTDDDEGISLSKNGNDYWAEVFVEEEEKWISVDLQKGKVHCINQLYKKATQPVRYILAWNNDGSIKDVTRRYAPQWLTVTRKQRAEDSWWQETIAPYRPPRTVREREEDEDLDRQIHDQPLPSSIADFKNHPLFALKRHLLKFQAIYPPDAPPLGFIKDEPVYSRGCIVELHTRETWIKEAKLVRRGEEPYKIVKARPKYDKLSGARLNDLPLPLFGYWQVEDYIPPPAVDGKVPRNEYGNVELYKPCMLPPGTVHLQVPGLGRVARKLEIDCAPAVVGWEFSAGGSHPVLDGFIVCEEFKDILLDAWNKEVDESAKRAREKIEQRVYGNWKRLIKGLLIKERLKERYDFGETKKAPEKKKKKQQPKAGSSKS